MIRDRIRAILLRAAGVSQLRGDRELAEPIAEGCASITITIRPPRA